MIFIFANRNNKAVIKHPKPYFMLRNMLIDEASGKYFVGQLTSAMAGPDDLDQHLIVKNKIIRICFEGQLFQKLAGKGPVSRMIF